MGVVIQSRVLQIKEDGGRACAPAPDRHLIAIGKYNAGQPFVYYFGGGWSEWGFASDRHWFNYMDTMQVKISVPLQVFVK